MSEQREYTPGTSENEEAQVENVNAGAVNQEKDEDPDARPPDSRASFTDAEDIDVSVPPYEPEELTVTETETEPKTELETYPGESIKPLLEALTNKMDEVKEGFERKAQADKHREAIISKLHAELQEHKDDLYRKLLKPVIMDIILIIDDINKFAGHYRGVEPSEMDPQKLLKALEDIPSDLEEALYRQGVEPVICEAETFDPARQKAIRTLATDDESKHRIVSQKLRTGFEWEGQVLRPEFVEVYKYEPEKARAALDTESEKGRESEDDRSNG
jgi:molecular chaperone GrpE